VYSVRAWKAPQPSRHTKKSRPRAHQTDVIGEAEQPRCRRIQIGAWSACLNCGLVGSPGSSEAPNAKRLRLRILQLQRKSATVVKIRSGPRGQGPNRLERCFACCFALRGDQQPCPKGYSSLTNSAGSVPHTNETGLYAVSIHLATTGDALSSSRAEKRKIERSSRSARSFNKEKCFCPTESWAEAILKQSRQRERGYHR